MGPKLSFVHSPKFKPVNAQGKDFNTKLKIYFFYVSLLIPIRKISFSIPLYFPQVQNF